MSQLNKLPVDAETLHPVDRRRRAAQHAVLSAFVPGLGQLAQGRRVKAAVHFLTVSTYVAAALGMGGKNAMFAAIAWNVWSAIDASRYDSD